MMEMKGGLSDALVVGLSSECNQGLGEQVQTPAQDNELAAYTSDRRTIVLAEV